MTELGDRRRLVMQLASQLPDEREEAIRVVEWLRETIATHWGSEAENIVPLKVVNCARRFDNLADDDGPCRSISAKRS